MDDEKECVWAVANSVPEEKSDENKVRVSPVRSIDG